MRKRYDAQKLVQRLNEKIGGQLDPRDTLFLGVVLKGLPVAYCLAKTNDAVENFIPIVAHRPLHMQHHVNSYFPSPEWKTYFQGRLDNCDNLLIADDVVNTGFTKQRLESIVYSLTREKGVRRRFAALVLNRRNLANPSFIRPSDVFALRVNAKEVECDWGLIAVPLWDLPIERARRRCEDYFQRFWLNEQRFITITY
jgi:adenine/guanine phosphoribosyltransferase-like PRPP-binding protein